VKTGHANGPSVACESLDTLTLPPALAGWLAAALQSRSHAGTWAFTRALLRPAAGEADYEANTKKVNNQRRKADLFRPRSRKLNHCQEILKEDPL
jgi:hypothetical protein